MFTKSELAILFIIIGATMGGVITLIVLGSQQAAQIELQRMHTVQSHNSTEYPTNQPTVLPTKLPTLQPTKLPTLQPTKLPTLQPTKLPTLQPTKLPTLQPTKLPTTNDATNSPITSTPTKLPTIAPTSAPTITPTIAPTKTPTTSTPSHVPTTSTPSDAPSKSPSISLGELVINEETQSTIIGSVVGVMAALGGILGVLLFANSTRGKALKSQLMKNYKSKTDDNNDNFMYQIIDRRTNTVNYVFNKQELIEFLGEDDVQSYIRSNIQPANYIISILQ